MKIENASQAITFTFAVTDVPLLTTPVWEGCKLRSHERKWSHACNELMDYALNLPCSYLVGC